jgi:hypothetical protein
MKLKKDAFDEGAGITVTFLIVTSLMDAEENK